MSNFIKEASEELEHVVWPTPTENKKYMMYTIGVIVTLALFLAILGYGITEGLKVTRAQFPHTPVVTPIVSGENNIADQLQTLQKQLQKNRSQSGTMSTSGTLTKSLSGTTAINGSGATKTK